MTPSWFKREIFFGEGGPGMAVVRRKLGLSEDGIFDAAVRERLRHLMGKRVDVIDSEVAVTLGESAATQAGLTPAWFVRPLERHDIGEDVRALRAALGVWDDNRFEHDCEAAVRRVQSAHGLDPTGRVDDTVAMLIGD